MTAGQTNISNTKIDNKHVAGRRHPAEVNKRSFLHGAPPLLLPLHQPCWECCRNWCHMVEQIFKNANHFDQVCPGEVTELQDLETQMAWVFPDWGGLRDHLKLSRTGHYVQQDAASSCRHNCVLSEVGDLSVLSHLRFFLLYCISWLSSSSSSEYALVCIFCQWAEPLTQESIKVPHDPVIPEKLRKMGLSVLHLNFACNEAKNKRCQKWNWGFCLCCCSLSWSLYVCFV